MFGSTQKSQLAEMIHAEKRVLRNAFTEGTTLVESYEKRKSDLTGLSIRNPIFTSLWGRKLTALDIAYAELSQNI